MSSERGVDLTVPLHPMLGIAFINFIFILFLLVVFFSLFAAPSRFEVRLPSLEGAPAENRATVRITGENVLYFNGKVLTFNDLKKEMVRINPANTVIYVQVDRRSSMGRTADILDLCKGLGRAEVRIIASQE